MVGLGGKRGESGVYVPCAICSLAPVKISNILSTSSTAAVRRSVVPLARRSSSLRSPGMSGSSRDMIDREMCACSGKELRCVVWVKLWGPGLDADL